MVVDGWWVAQSGVGRGIVASGGPLHRAALIGCVVGGYEYEDWVCMPT